ncbi:hypothetical protein [Marinomonas mediterranea]|jgi:Late embryogenesis abundant protein.|uniref:Late embryogenesis abundant protein n=1 Tax=Marinomonas mediterranea (strain ATCC 700492 / JCM 21426 / NBRC 103028 / MMB-1) TaxID=717774 RepID=F2K4K3_MARM1|nr:hypothetical protein [Marinomonas mediterranea]ADZ91396.1 hypothetical protein Marme_2153 [Marinomonas mediterranea MMB-1]WCN09368.1 hypothetical protein GV055_10720 [Marinomonas mediterranea]WCN13445.1 hypothetical protein GV054_10725 [Marinomonas mediterranea]WCN17511.1 hypothetical protein GV053_10835 [Marinomonas mediterranea MMB-1]
MNKLITMAFFCASIVSISVHAEQSTLETAKEKASELSDSALEKGKEVYEKATEKASEVGGDASDKAKEIGLDIWSGVKKAGNAAAGYVEEGAAKVKEMTDDEESESNPQKNECESSFFNSCEEK